MDNYLASYMRYNRMELENIYVTKQEEMITPLDNGNSPYFIIIDESYVICNTYIFDKNRYVETEKIFRYIDDFVLK